MPGDSLLKHPILKNFPLRDSLQHRAIAVSAADDERFGFLSFFVILAFILLAILFLIVFNKIRLHWRRQKAIQLALAELPLVASGYNDLLLNYNSYYKSLNPALRERFLERLVAFMRTKTFDYINITPDDRMPVLVSAAAIQISFGLEKYLFDAFETIHILQHDYQYAGYSRPFMGHVNFTGIYLSWDNFLKGYENDTDANNVGIHEMAHALAFVNFMAEKNEGIDDDFQKRFQTFSSIARPIFEEMWQGVSNMMDNYAATNYNEFWAVAMENFFEKPAEMKDSLPELYHAMVSLLNQDPLTPHKILHI
jgi:hypothetical protein